MAEYKLTKNLTINNIEEICKGIAEHLRRFNHLSLTIPESIEVDFSGVQLLYSINTTAQSLNKTISIRYQGQETEVNPFGICDFKETIAIK